MIKLNVTLYAGKRKIEVPIGASSCNESGGRNLFLFTFEGWVFLVSDQVVVVVPAHILIFIENKVKNLKYLFLFSLILLASFFLFSSEIVNIYFNLFSFF